MKMLIDGKLVDSFDGEVMTVRAPYDNEILDEVPKAGRRDLDAALDAAVRGQKEWAAVPLYRRVEILKRFMDLVKDHQEELIQTLCKDNGKPYAQAKAEISNLFVSVPAFSEKAKHIYEEVIPPGTEPGQDRTLQIVRRYPVGVVVCVIPFNFPVNLFSQKAIPALLAGNAALVLPPSGNPLTVLMLCSLLNEAGVVPGAIQAVTAPGAAKEYALSDSRTDLVSLTGSTETGIRVAQLASEHLIPYTLELGGNDPFIVFEDADMDLVISEIFEGRLNNNGQICCSSKRFLIQRPLVETFTERARTLVEGLRTGDPMDPETQISCLIDEKAASEVERQVEHTVSQGAKILTGGVRKGTYYAPTILTNVTPEMDIASDMEIFGPVVPVIPFDTEEEAVRIANNSIYGLSSCIFTKDYGRIIRMTEALEEGDVIVNGSNRLRTFEMPFGGWKMSGVGTEGVMSTFDHMTKVKTVILKNAL